MRTKLFLLLVGSFIALGSVARAGITSVQYTPLDGNLYGGTNALSYDLTHEVATMNMNWEQYDTSSGSGVIHTDTPDDPSLIIGGSIDNDTSFSWLGYRIRVYMDRTFTLSNVTVGTPPTGWNVSYSTPALNGSPVYYGAGEYVAQIDYTGPPPVNVGDQFNFSYKLTFIGSTTYGFTQEMTPLEAIPEPSVVALGAMGLLGLVGMGRRRFFARK